MVLYFAANYRETTERKATQSNESSISDSQDEAQGTTPAPAAKIVLVNSDQSQPPLVSTPPSKESSSQQNTPSPPAASPPPPPSAPSCPEEFIGTVTLVSENQVTFSYGNSQSVTIQLTKTSPSALPPGTKAHVHAKLQNNVCVEDEIEV